MVASLRKFEENVRRKFESDRTSTGLNVLNTMSDRLINIPYVFEWYGVISYCVERGDTPLPSRCGFDFDFRFSREEGV